MGEHINLDPGLSDDYEKDIFSELSNEIEEDGKIWEGSEPSSDDNESTDSYLNYVSELQTDKTLIRPSSVPSSTSSTAADTSKV